MKPRPSAAAHENFQAAKAEFTGLSSHEIFEKIHRTNLWGSAKSVSGLGSDLTSTAHIREALPELCREFGVRTLLDIPCGDFNWLSQVELPIERYIGADIVDEIVLTNREKYTGEFLKLDLCSDPLPGVDLVFCRDCLVHLSNQAIWQAIANLKRSGSTWLLTTHFLECSENADIATGDWRMLNFTLAPFGWPPPTLTIVEGCEEAGGGYSDKSLALWRIADLP